MHYYFYHEELRKSKYSKYIFTTENSFNKLGINGKIIRLGQFTTLDESLRKYSKEHNETFIFLGNEMLLSQIINLPYIKENNIIIGYIPFFKKDNISQSLGIGFRNEAVQTISRKHVEKINLGIVNENCFFIDSISLSMRSFCITMDDTYTITNNKTCKEINIKIVNLPQCDFNSVCNKHINPLDKKLSIIIQTNSKKNEFSCEGFFSFYKLVLETSDTQSVVTVDNSIKLKTPITVTMSKNNINMIVGKNRLF